MLPDEGQVFFKTLSSFRKNLPNILMTGFFDIFAKIYNQFDMSPTFFYLV